ncbi:MAG: protein translocase subunit SecF [Planctomycetota bacterium]|nr:protein translocase subunit SecF [Planctomycetota bacterium]
MVTVLKAGSLPVKLAIDSENKVGAALGEDSIRAGTMALIIGFALVVMVMLLYYLGAGILAVVALLLNAVIILGCLGLFQATLTLPGIAGIVLTLGMAVDANVLIFERIREEKAAGKALKVAIKNGYERAFITILDANVTTIITAIILYSVGTVFIKSFAVTLTIGLLASMFTAVFVTRALVEILYDANIVKKLNMLLLFKTPNINFLKLRAFGVIASVILIAIGIAVFASTASFGIDFTGGEMIQIRTTKAVSIDDVRKMVYEKLGEGANVQTYADPNVEASATEGSQFVITYASPDDTEGEEGMDAHSRKEEFKAYIREQLPELAPVAFEKLEEVSDDEIDSSKYEEIEEKDEIVSDFFNIRMNLLKPASPEAVKGAIESIAYNEGLEPHEQLQVLEISAVGDGNESTTFDILLRTGELAAADDALTATMQLRAELTNRLDDVGITLSDPFPREQSIGRSLSSDLQTMGIWAIILSSLAMLIYITFRFRFAFGVGAVVALIHDLFMTLGIIALLDVQISLDVLAAILTVLGYSLNDTIVVFDRMRENMRTFKKRDFRDVLNISINQVLSRTVLTSVTTAAVIIALIIFSGDVLRGFAITLLVGVLTGTYSSVFIATPVVAAYEGYRKSREESVAKAQKS